jgi:hypothetical protein
MACVWIQSNCQPAKGWLAKARVSASLDQQTKSLPAV